MKPIQILMDERELALVDQEAARQGLDRSKLMREAMRRYLAGLTREAHERDYVESYRAKPDDLKEVRAWQKAQAWPED